MSDVPIKYLIDENGNKFSPVVSTSSVYTGGGYPLTEKMELLYSGTLSIPSRQSDNYESVFVLSDPNPNIIANYERLIFVRSTLDAMSSVSIVDSNIQTIDCSVASIASSTYGNELINIFTLRVKIESSAKHILKLGGNSVTQIYQNGTTNVSLGYEGNPIIRIYGIRR